MELMSKRLILRELTIDDLDCLYEILSGVDTVKHYLRVQESIFNNLRVL